MPGRSDDPATIPNDVRLFRRINPEWVVFDKNRHQWRPTSQNFQDSRDGSPMSVFAENLAVEHGERPSDFLQGLWSAWNLTAVPAGWMRECQQSVYRDLKNQEPDDFHPSHAAVEGSKANSKLRSKLAERFEWVVGPSKRPEE
jgi:hypothetical protein